MTKKVCRHVCVNVYTHVHVRHYVFISQRVCPLTPGPPLPGVSAL